MVSDAGGAVNEGTVTFVVINPFGANLTTSSTVNSGGSATATLTIPAGFSAGD